jgi:hypothetical protein
LTAAFLAAVPRDIIKGIRLDPWHMDVSTAFHHVFWMGDLNYRLDWGEQAFTSSAIPSTQGGSWLAPLA